jgi:hypothetical protein
MEKTGKVGHLFHKTSKMLNLNTGYSTAKNVCKHKLSPE